MGIPEYNSDPPEYKMILLSPGFHPVSVPRSTVLCTEEYPGPFSFEVCVIPNDNGTKNPWEYSALKNKLFIKLSEAFPVDFSVKHHPDNMQLFIRLTPAFSSPQHSQELVHRCINHEYSGDPSNLNVPDYVRQHVIRCDNPKTYYVGDKDKDERLSVVIPLGKPQTGSDNTREFCRFVCQTSCPSGMNRKPIHVIFTLEDENAQIYGRRLLFARICCCPKRDKEKEEKDYDANKDLLSRGKKRKIKTEKKLVPSNDVADTKEYTINNVKIIGKCNYQLVLKYCHDLMAGEALKREHQNVVNCPYKKCANDIGALLNNY